MRQPSIPIPPDAVPRPTCPNNTGTLRLAVLVLVALCAMAGAGIGAGTHEDAPPDFALAHVYRPGDETVNLAEYWMSEKYDGVRALWDGRRLLSRGGKPFAAPAWFVDALPAAVLDGELWLGRGRFEDTTSVVRRSRPHEGWRDIQYMVFDLPEHGGVFRERYAALIALAAEHPGRYWRVAPHEPIESPAALEQRFADITAGGGEGLILRRVASRHHGGRSDDLLKYKRFTDADAVVVGHNPGKGKYTGLLGSLRVRASDGTVFNVGSGLSDAQRRHPPPVGATITYKYQGLTGDGLPRFPVFLRLRRDVPEDVVPETR